jgi:hypothetical protein
MATALTLQASQVPTFGTSSYGSVALGTASADRVIIVVGHFITSGAGSVTCTVAGNAMTEHAISGSANGHKTGIYSATIASGTSGTVAFSGGSIFGAGFGLWSATGINATPAVTQTTTGTGTLGLNCNTTLDAAGVGGVDYFGGGPGVSWTGATQGYDLNNSGDAGSGASFIASSAQTPRTISCGLPGGSSGGTGAFAIFPAVVPPGQPTIKRAGGVTFMHGSTGFFGRGGGRW